MMHNISKRKWKDIGKIHSSKNHENIIPNRLAKINTNFGSKLAKIGVILGAKMAKIGGKFENIIPLRNYSAKE